MIFLYSCEKSSIRTMNISEKSKKINMTPLSFLCSWEDDEMKIWVQIWYKNFKKSMKHLPYRVLKIQIFFFFHNIFFCIFDMNYWNHFVILSSSTIPLDIINICIKILVFYFFTHTWRWTAKISDNVKCTRTLDFYIVFIKFKLIVEKMDEKKMVLAIHVKNAIKMLWKKRRRSGF